MDSGCHFPKVMEHLEIQFDLFCFVCCCFSVMIMSYGIISWPKASRYKAFAGNNYADHKCYLLGHFSKN